MGTGLPFRKVRWMMVRVALQHDAIRMVQLNMVKKVCFLLCAFSTIKNI